MTSGARDASHKEIAERLRGERAVLAVTHEAPDGDALGCLSAFSMVCEHLGVPCTLYAPGTGRFPEEYTFLPGVRSILRGTVPPLSEETTIYFLDCASLLRGGPDGFPAGLQRVNIDHHQDNPRFGEVNLVDHTAPSTTAILYQVFKAGGLPLDEQVATALYVGLVTDTGKFQFSNTTPAAHRVAAELQEAGCDVNAVNRAVYESLPMPKAMLLGRMLTRMHLRLEGALVTAWLNDRDLTETGAEEGYTEGLIDTLRQVGGVRLAVLARQRDLDGRPETKVSLRSTDGAIDVAELAHQFGGGGHVRAAGFTVEGSAEEILARIETIISSRL